MAQSITFVPFEGNIPAEWLNCIDNGWFNILGNPTSTEDLLQTLNVGESATLTSVPNAESQAQSFVNGFSFVQTRATPSLGSSLGVAYDPAREQYLVYDGTTRTCNIYNPDGSFDSELFNHNAIINNEGVDIEIRGGNVIVLFFNGVAAIFNLVSGAHQQVGGMDTYPIGTGSSYQGLYTRDGDVRAFQRASGTSIIHWDATPATTIDGKEALFTQDISELGATSSSNLISIASRPDTLWYSLDTTTHVFNLNYDYTGVSSTREAQDNALGSTWNGDIFWTASSPNRLNEYALSQFSGATLSGENLRYLIEVGGRGLLPSGIGFTVNSFIDNDTITITADSTIASGVQAGLTIRDSAVGDRVEVVRSNPPLLAVRDRT